MTISIEDRTSVAAIYCKESNKTILIDRDEIQPIVAGVFIVGCGEYVRVIPNPRTDPDTSYGVHGKREGFGGWISYDDGKPDKMIAAGETADITDAIRAIGTD